MRAGLTAVLAGFLSLASITFAQGQAALREEADYVIYSRGQRVTFDQMAESLASADIVAFGEQHGHGPGHALEAAILKALHQRSPKTALALEMFERDVQGVLDEYLAGLITETHFLQSSRPWPRYKTDYAPMVEYARANNLPVIAANAPRRYVNIVSRKGQDALRELPRASRAFLAPLPVSMDLPEGYDRWLNTLFGQQHGATPVPGMPSTRNMKESQALWDATMADSILRFRRANRGWKVFHANGAGHSDHGYGVVARLRQADRRLKVAIVTVKPGPGFPSLPAGTEETVADYVIATRADPAPARP